VRLIQRIGPLAAFGLCNHLDIGFLLKQPAKAGANDCMIVDQHDRNRLVVHGIFRM
jgi:hypothetical protein